MSRLKITDLKFGQCRYPIESGAHGKHFFCGERTESEKCPYCPAHAALCFDRRPDVRKHADAQRLALARAARKSAVYLTGPVAVGGLPHESEIYRRDS